MPTPTQFSTEALRKRFMSMPKEAASTAVNALGDAGGVLFDAYKKANRKFSVPVGLAAGALGGAVGGAVGAVGTPISNALRGRPLSQDLWKNTKESAVDTAEFGYGLGTSGADVAPLGGAGKIVNAVVAAPLARDVYNDVSSGEIDAETGMNAAMLGMAARGIAKQPNLTPGGVFDPQLKALGSRFKDAVSGGAVPGGMTTRPVSDFTKAKDYANRLMKEEHGVWKKLGIRSGSQIEADPELQAKYMDAVTKLPAYKELAKLPKEMVHSIQDVLENENFHTLNGLIDPSQKGNLLYPTPSPKDWNKAYGREMVDVQLDDAAISLPRITPRQMGEVGKLIQRGKIEKNASPSPIRSIKDGAPPSSKSVIEDGTKPFSPKDVLNGKKVHSPDSEAPKMSNYRAVGIAEGFEEASSIDEVRAAWQHIADTGLYRHLQGWFGRTLSRLIDAGEVDPPPGWGK